MTSTASSITEAQFVTGITLPDSALVLGATTFIQDIESSLLFNHSSLVFCFASLAGQSRALKFEPELLDIGAMFHDMELVQKYSSNSDRFEVDGANAARDFFAETSHPVPVVFLAAALSDIPTVAANALDELR